MSGFEYRVGGLRVASGRPLPDLDPLASDGRVPDVRIAFGPLTPLPGAVSGPFQVHSPHSADFTLPDRLRIRIADGQRLTVDAVPHVSASEIQTFLFGPAFAALLHQRGTPPLHAGAVAVGARAVAVAGASGAGKSTALRALLAVGCRFLTDDQLVVDPATMGVEPGVPALKLWAAAAAHFHDRPDDDRRVMPGRDKFHMALPAPACGPLPLKAVCILVPQEGIARPSLERLSLTQAVVALGNLSHHAYAADLMGRRRAIFEQAVALAERVPVFLLLRPDDLSAIDHVAHLIRDMAQAAVLEDVP
ncbi:hypothetical protein [Aquabacter cavernae]|uniref:hypothetical protein n=1 Tax=Aquabacter cavernae TaxID=2496029 RepID=UPI000F8C41DD|nr:hypothetical protein [Aquabacter cavernae]